MVTEIDIKKIIVKAIKFHEYEMDKLVDDIELDDDSTLIIVKDNKVFLINIMD